MKVQWQVKRVVEVALGAGLTSLDLAAVERELKVRSEALAVANGLVVAMRPWVAGRPEVATWRLTDIGGAFEAIAKAGGDALSLRSNALSNPVATNGLRRLVAECRGLQQERSALGRRVSLVTDLTAAALNACAAALRSGGVFRALSSEYRRAAREAKRILLSDKFDRAQAIISLDELAAYRVRERQFLQDPQAAILFGPHFRGGETDIELFERLANYYETVNVAVAAADKRALRAFLRDAELDELELVPAVPAGLDAETFELLQEHVEKTGEGLGALAEGLRALRPLLVIFREPGSLVPADLRSIGTRLRAVLETQHSLETAPPIPSFLGQFQGWRTPTASSREAIDWAVSSLPHAASVAAVLATEHGLVACAHIREVIEAEGRAISLLADLCEAGKMPSTHFDVSRSPDEVAEALARASADSDGLFLHGTFATSLKGLRDVGVAPLIEHRLASRQDFRGLADQVHALAVRLLARNLYTAQGEHLARYTGTNLDELRAALAKKDREIIHMSRRQLRCRVHAAAAPPHGNGSGRKSTWTQMALIDNEIAKQKRFVSVRDLTERAGEALQQLKPCWMMSPLAVAQYVKKGGLAFDLCVIDEASQMPPEAAIGALLRCSQTVVVGDTNQLPPSSFFKKMIDDEEADEDEAVLNESVLEMANATFRPSRRLRWHYRSRHSGLIKFSNRLVYNDNLVVFPSATESMVTMGVEFRQVDGLYKAGTNPVEARAIVDAILEFMRDEPDRSLGVVTLNQKQRDLISEEFEYALSKERTALAYVEAWKDKKDGLEEFFIKNLENVQGDERDVIFIGTVYGPEAKGARVMQRFGPINGLAGKRRLNVLFSRAKEKIITFSSMTAADVLAEEGGNAGVYMLKRWLEYSATGILDGGSLTEREPDSDFEQFVINQIRAMGYEPVPQVGVAGYFVDIGIRHPDWAHGFVLGVECDGASYHSAKSARDRDRLRQEVLEGLGWRLHRIWSTDWFNNPQREAERLRGIIVARMAELKAREAEFVRPVRTAGSQPETRSVGPVVSQPSLFPEPAPASGHTPRTVRPTREIEIGDMVRMRYLSDDRKVLEVTISRKRSDPGAGVIHCDTPIAKALLGAEEGDEVEVLVGNFVRPAVVESIKKQIGI